MSRTFGTMLGYSGKRHAKCPVIHHPHESESADGSAKQQELVMHAAGRHEFHAAMMPVIIGMVMPVVFVVTVAAIRTVLVPVI
jgi:hypothetical protein